MASFTLMGQKPTENRKLGSKETRPMFSTYRPVTKKLSKTGKALDGTCPSACPFLTKCYANLGYVNIIQRKALDRIDNLVERIKALPANAIVRHLVSGDFGKGDKLDDYLDEAIEAHKQRPDVTGFSYTHHWRNYSAERFNQVPNLRINASCETPDEVRLALKNGWMAVQVVPEDTPDSVDYDGYKLVVCPEQSKGISCADCMLCARQRKAVIGFRAHASNKAEISNIVRGE